MKPMVAPSILAADFANLETEIKMLNESESDWLHLDVMDGLFVPNISFGLPVCEAIGRHSTKPLDVHLMIVQPERYLQAFRDSGAAMITVHYEACPHLHRSLQQIKDTGAQAGIALNPHTPVSVLSEILAHTDLVCLMSVNPGFGGQKFIENTFNKVRALRKIAENINPKLHIEIDGGVNLENAPLLLKAGADVLVAGSTVFKSKNPKETIKTLKKPGF